MKISTTCTTSKYEVYIWVTKFKNTKFNFGAPFEDFAPPPPKLPTTRYIHISCTQSVLGPVPLCYIEAVVIYIPASESVQVYSDNPHKQRPSVHATHAHAVPTGGHYLNKLQLMTPSVFECKGWAVTV